MTCLDCHRPAELEGRCVTHAVAEMDRKAGAVHHYFLTRGDEPEVEVTKEEWVAAERWAGFHNTLGHDNEPATGGFYSSVVLGGIRGRIERTLPS